MESRFETYSILDIVKRIDSGEMLLPAIQRNFTWKTAQIEKLFNSIAKGFPIGTVILWHIPKNIAKDLSLYRFDRDYEDGLNSYTEKNKQSIYANTPDLTAVLDGQQRLSSFYVVYYGNVFVKRKEKGKQVRKKAHLYVNLFSEELDFKFYHEGARIKRDENNLWIRFEDIIEKVSKEEVKAFTNKYIDDVLSDLKEDNPFFGKVSDEKALIKEKILELYDTFTEKKVVSAFNLQDGSIDEVLEAFIRVNSGGIPLSKMDLVFAIIAKKWADAKSYISSLTNLIYGNYGYKIDVDIILKTALGLIGESTKLRKNLINPETAEKIRDNWNTVRESVEKTAQLLYTKGNFVEDDLVTKNALVPIAVYYGLIGDKKLSSAVEDDLLTLFILFVIKSFFGTHADTTLNNTVKEMRNLALEGKPFKLSDYISKVVNETDNKDLYVRDKDIEDILNTKKGSRELKIAFLLLYPNRKGGMDFHEDHIFPSVSFRGKPDLAGKANLLPNLQLLLQQENLTKNGKPFDEWIKEEFKNVEDFEKYAKMNYIPVKTKMENGKKVINYDYYKIDNFNQFFSDRREILKNKLKKIFESKGVYKSGEESEG